MKKAMRFKAAWPVWGGGATVCRKMAKLWSREFQAAEKAGDKFRKAGVKP